MELANDQAAFATGQDVATSDSAIDHLSINSGDTESADSDPSPRSPCTIEDANFMENVVKLPDLYEQTTIDGRTFIDTSENLNDELPGVSGPCGLVSFVAKDINERIRSESPPVSPDSPSFVGTTQFSSVNNSALLPDSKVLDDLHGQAKQVAHSLDRILLELKGTLHGMTSISKDYVGIYSHAVSETCDSVDTTVKQTYQLLARTEELTHLLRPVPKLAQQIKEIKRVLDLFESHMQKSFG